MKIERFSFTVIAISGCIRMTFFDLEEERYIVYTKLRRKRGVTKF